MRLLSRLLPAVSLLALASGLVGCGQSAMMTASGRMRNQMLHGNYEAALGTLRKSKEVGFKEQDRVAYWMNEGMLLHLVGRYLESNQVLEKAELRAKELYTVSISKTVSAAFTSDAAKDYEGEDYENILVNVVKALNYLALHNLQDALVEAHRINEKLVIYYNRYQQKPVYNQDAFAHWLMGLLFEMERSYDDARIAYVKAMDVYERDFAFQYKMRPPSYLAEDMVRAALLSHSSEDAARYRQRFGHGLGKSFEALHKNGEIVLVHLNGEGPNKGDYTISCYFHSIDRWGCDAEPGGEFMRKISVTFPKDATVIKIAFPELHTHNPAGRLAMTVAGVTVQAEKALPINEIAQKALRDKMRRIFRDAVIRAITKTASSKGAGEVGKAIGGGEDKGLGALLGGLFETATSAVMQATEEADKRAWTTLPAEIEVARVIVPPGVHDVELRLSSGKTARIPGVKVEAGKRVVLSHRTMP
jgi:tetratricopeptide (TPR) repeat protein